MKTMYLEMALGSLLGVAIYALVKVRSINNRMADKTYVDVLKAYLYEDRVSINISLISIMIFIFISSEWLDYELLNIRFGKFIKTFSVAFGYMSSSIVASFLSRTEQKLNDKMK